jgi:START domain
MAMHTFVSPSLLRSAVRRVTPYRTRSRVASDANGPASRLHLRKRFAPLVFLFLAFQAQPAWPQVEIDSTGWELESSSNGILLYSGRAAGTNIVPFKAVMTIPASIEEIAAVLEDRSRRAEWVARFGESVLLEKPSAYAQTEYVRMRMPWPFSDRTARVQVEVVVAEDLKAVAIEGRSVECCPRADLPEFVRAEVYDSTFQMVTERGRTTVTIIAFVDPRGYLAPWVVNLFTGGEARRTLEGLRTQVERRLYPPSVITAFRKRMEGYATRSRE